MDALALRLKPGDDLKQALLQHCCNRKIDAACILTCAGSLQRAVLRYADKPNGVAIAGPLEIVSLVGTLSQHGLHLHIALSDGEGRVVGGHVLEGCYIHTTAEIVLGVLPGTCFRRELDPETGYRELEISRT